MTNPAANRTPNPYPLASSRGMGLALCMMGLALGGTAAGMVIVDAIEVSAHATPPAASQPAEWAGGDLRKAEAYEETIPETTVSFRMLPVPGDGRDIEPFYLSATEVTWDLYDLYAFAEDSAATGSPKGADAVSKPSKPYLPPDRGFGHTGYPVLSTAMPAAQRFCEWLSDKTGHRYRLPTEAEWVHACALNAEGQPAIDEVAWYAANAEDKTHPVASKKAGALGLFDMCGNAGEWVVATDGKPTAMGGSFKSDADQLCCGAMQKQERSWQMSDPQLPKSKWWLSDCSWVTFRVVREMD